MFDLSQKSATVPVTHNPPLSRPISATNQEAPRSPKSQRTSANKGNEARKEWKPNLLRKSAPSREAPAAPSVPRLPEEKKKARKKERKEAKKTRYYENLSARVPGNSSINQRTIRWGARIVRWGSRPFSGGSAIRLGVDRLGSATVGRYVWGQRQPPRGTCFGPLRRSGTCFAYLSCEHLWGGFFSSAPLRRFEKWANF